MLNQKGSFILYISFTIILLLIGAIIYYVYLENSTTHSRISSTHFGTSPTNTEKNTKKNVNNNLLEKLKEKLPPSKIQTPKEKYENSYKISAKLYLNSAFDVKDKNIDIIGKPTLIFGELGKREFIIKDPKLVDFSGSFTNKEFTGTLTNIITNTDELEILSKLDSNYSDIKEIDIDNLDIDFEGANITGTINIQNKTYNLDKVYLNIKGFSGNAKITPDKNSAYLELNGSLGYFDMIDNQVETTLK